MAMFESLPGLGGLGDKLGGIFDFGGDEGQIDQMEPPEIVQDMGEGIGSGIMGRLFQSQVGTWFDGPDIGDYDLLEAQPSKTGGFLPSITVTPTGKKWGLILLAVGVLYVLTKGGKRGRR